MPGYLKPQQLPASVTNDQECEQPIERYRRDHAQIKRGNRLGVIAQKRLSTLRWWLSATDHLFRDGGLSHLKAQHQQLTVDSGTRPTAGSPGSFN
jgi:hypothetical protein